MNKNRKYRFAKARGSSATHCPKNNQNLCIKTTHVTDRAKASVKLNFFCQTFSIESVPAVIGSVFYVEIQIILETVHCIIYILIQTQIVKSNFQRNSLLHSAYPFSICPHIYCIYVLSLLHTSVSIFLVEKVTNVWCMYSTQHILVWLVWQVSLPEY